MRQVTVVVPADKVEAWGEISVANYVTRELRKGGAAIGDGLLPLRVEDGRVLIETDAFGELTVTWEGGQ